MNIEISEQEILDYLYVETVEDGFYIDNETQDVFEFILENI